VDRTRKPEKVLNIVGFIFARGGSKGILNKNIRLLVGKPLIAYSIEAALRSNYIDRVVVSTDSEKIANVARSFGADVPFIRPSELARDNSPEILAWRHALETLNGADNRIDVFVSIPPTAPLRSTEDIDDCIRVFLEGETDAVITVRNAARHPSFNMVMLNEQGFANLVLPPDETITRRQDAPKVFDVTTVAYVFRPDFIMKMKSLFDGKIRTVVIPEERAVDIDTELDFQFAEFILGKRTGEKGKKC